MKYLYIILFLITGTLVSCVQDDTSDVSRITNYPIITVNGSSELFLQQGASYTDAGAVATEGGVEIPVTTTISTGTYFGNTFGTDSPDKYTATYSAVNVDGFTGNALKSIWVIPTTGDLVTSIEGLYTASVQRAPSFSALPKYTDLEYVFIYKISANKYGISHAIGGYYDLGNSYGSNYAAKGATVTVNNLATNDFSYTGAFINGFGLAINITDFIVDSGSKSITYTGAGSFTNGTFKVQLKQVQL